MTGPLFIPLVQNTGIEIQRAKNRHRARSVAYLCMAALNVVVTVALAPSMGYWAPAIGYVSYIVLGCGVFMNWYYQARIELDMAYFWRRVLPVVGVALMATAVCGVGSYFVPVTGWGLFIAWGAIYTLFYAGLVWVFVLSGEERSAIVSNLRRA